MDVLKPLSVNIKRLRKGKNLTQAVLAEKVNLSSIFITEIERGKRYPSLQNLEKIAKVLEVEPFKLLMPEESEFLYDDRRKYTKNITDKVRELLNDIDSNFPDIEN